jgi:hypothetical protein
MKKLTALMLSALPLVAAEPPSWSGIYPHLAYFNEEGECGTGAVVPWADRLWVITYGPHLPFGSTDKLYEITPDLQQVIRPESVGGTPANRMIHRESQQLVIGPYFIDPKRNVRVVPPKLMPGRHTGNARHLTDPAGKVYFATMEEGLYEVDVKTLEVTGLIKDGNGAKPGQTSEKKPAVISSQLPGYHGKGLFSGQGRLVYANNGERSKDAERDPRTESGALGEWTGEGDWKLVRRNQFTEVSGPGGIEGNADPAKDPVWSIGWDARSLILMVLDQGKWHAYRLPKASHCYDGAHGWNTEWPRIRDIGEKDLLMTMHGMFWRFPKSFSASHAAGIRPRSTYLKVIGDFCEWNGRLVFGCDDTAKSAFLNSKSGNEYLANPGQSHSNLWFAAKETPDLLGPPLGRGAVWLRENVKADTPSEPFLFAGYQNRTLHLSHKSAKPVTITMETDREGNGDWKPLSQVTIPANGSSRVDFTGSQQGEWIRLRTDGDATALTAAFVYSNPDTRGTTPDKMFDGIATVASGNSSSGWMRVRGNNRRTLLLAAGTTGKKPGGEACYELDAAMKLRPLTTPPAKEELRLGTRTLHGNLRVEAASVVFTDEAGRNWRLPRGAEAFDALTASGAARIQREVCTERYLFNCHGTFYELPTENAGGFAKIRPVSSHNLAIGDFASYRGLLVMTGIDGGASNPHIIRSEDGKAAVWAGAIDDLWKLGKPTGTGGPWLDSPVEAGVPSDPYLFTGYDRKSISVSHKGSGVVSFRIELDVTGEGDWVLYQNLDVKPGAANVHEFPAACQAYWIRLVPNAGTTATARLEYR